MESQKKVYDLGKSETIASRIKLKRSSLDTYDRKNSSGKI